MSSNMSLGKFGKAGNIDTNKIKAGMKREDLKSENLKNFFDRVIDKSNDAGKKDGVASEQEIKNFLDDIRKFAKNNRLSEREFKNYLVSKGYSKEEAKELAKQLGDTFANMDNASKDIKDSKFHDDGTIVINKNDGSKETRFEDGTVKIIDKDGKTITTKPDGSKTIVNTDGTQENYDSNGKLLNKMSERTINSDKTELTTDDYTSNTRTITHVPSDNYKETIEFEDEFQTPKSKIIQNGIKQEEYSYPNGKEQLDKKITNKGLPTETTSTYKYDETGKTETVQDLIGNKAITKFNNNNKRLSQQKTINGETFQVSYDGNGNTTGIIVQNGETIEQLAKKFNCSADDLKEVNKEILGDKKYFNAGDEIKIPKELEADAPELQGRKDKAGVETEYKEIQAEKARVRAQIKAQKQQRAAAREAKYKELGLINHKGQGSTIKGDFWDNKTKKIKYSKNFKVIGQCQNGRTLAQDQKGNIYVIAHNGVVLKQEYVKDPKTFKKLNSTADPKATAINTQINQLHKAEAAFNKQLKEDGWAGDVADGVSALWGSKNRASEVRKDLAAYRKDITELKKAYKQGEAQFKAKFQQIYGVPFNEQNIKAYSKNPTDANYKKAYGTKHNIVQRILNYNKSQQTGAAVVKTTTEVAGAVALTAATVATGGAVGVVAGVVTAGASTVAADVIVETTDRMSSEQGLQDGEMTEIVKGAAVDGAIAAATLGVAKGAQAAYKTAKVANSVGKTATAATKAESSATKIASTTTKAETGIVETGQQVANTSEKGLVKAEQQAANTASNTTKQTAKSGTLNKTEEAVIDTTADVTVGAGAEYIETGDVTVEGTLINAAVGTVGLAGEKIGSKLKGHTGQIKESISNAYHKAEDKVSNAYHKAKDGVEDAVNDAKDKFKNTKGPNTAKDSQNNTHNTNNNGTDGAKKADNTNYTGKTNTENNTNNTNKTDTNSNKTYTTDNAQKTNKSEKTYDVNNMSENEIKQAINELEPKLKEAQVADYILKEYSDFLNNISPLDRANFRKLSLKSHPDRDGSDELFQLVNNLKDAKTAQEIRNAKNKLKTFINEKSAKLSEYRQQMDKLRPDAKAETNAADNTQKSAKTDKTSNTNSGTKLSDEINKTFGYKTRTKLEKLPEGQNVVLEKGKFRYIIKNENGEIKIVKKQGKVNLDIPMSDRTPAGKNGRVSMNDVLSPESKEIYRDSYGAYLQTKDKKIIHNATDMITEDNLLHGTNLDALIGEGGILDNGLVPREFSGNAKAAFANGSVPNTLTPYCTDVWDVHGSQSIKDYFDPGSSHWANRGESNFLSNRGNNRNSYRSAVMVVLDKKSMHPDLLNNSFNVNSGGRSPLIDDGGIGGIGDGIHDYPTHRAIPIGAPANAIDRIIVDTRRLSSQQLGALRDKIAASGLDIKIYDMSGKLLTAA